MFEKSITHNIQKHIIDVLHWQKSARFRDLRTPDVDTNKFAYHLKLLTKSGMIEKAAGEYTLGENGLKYVDRVGTENTNVRTQPNIISMFVIQNSDGDILLYRRNKQPYIDTWTLPYGKIHIEDSSIEAAAKRQAKERLDVDVASTHAGDCYVRVQNGRQIMTSTLVHVLRFETDEIVETDQIHWARPHKLAQYELAPAVEQIIARTFFRDPFLFEEYVVER